jgi:hypothetical protein
LLEPLFSRLFNQQGFFMRERSFQNLNDFIGIDRARRPSGAALCAVCCMRATTCPFRTASFSDFEFARLSPENVFRACVVFMKRPHHRIAC